MQTELLLYQIFTQQTLKWRSEVLQNLNATHNNNTVTVTTVTVVLLLLLAAELQLMFLLLLLLHHHELYWLYSLDRHLWAPPPIPALPGCQGDLPVHRPVPVKPEQAWRLVVTWAQQLLNVWWRLSEIFSAATNTWTGRWRVDAPAGHSEASAGRYLLTLLH